MIEGERDSLTGNFMKPIAVNDSTGGSVITNESDFKSYMPFFPFQKIRHHKIVLNSNFIFGNASIKTIVGFQQNHRKEFD